MTVLYIKEPRTMYTLRFIINWKSYFANNYKDIINAIVWIKLKYNKRFNGRIVDIVKKIQFVPLYPLDFPRWTPLFLLLNIKNEKLSNTCVYQTSMYMKHNVLNRMNVFNYRLAKHISTKCVNVMFFYRNS